MSGAARHVSGPLPISDALRRALGLCEAVRAAGVLPSDRSWVPRQKPSLGIQEVERVEAEIGAQIPGEVLALVAIRDPIVELAVGLEGLESILDASEGSIEVTGGGVEGAAGKWTGLCVAYSEPLAELFEGAHGGPYRGLAYRAGGDIGASPLEVLVLEDDAPVAISTLGEVIFETLSAGVRGQDLWSRVEAERARVEPGGIEAILVDNRASRVSAARRVRHKTFGAGTVVAMRGGGPEARATVEFDTAGEKLVLARFLEDL